MKESPVGLPNRFWALKGRFGFLKKARLKMSGFEEFVD